METLHEKLKSSETPKRILSLDGGGIRGALTLGMLAKIEAEIRKKPGCENMVLADYYDLIIGTSTGAIIASCLAIGKTVEEVTDLYRNLGSEIFGKGRKNKFLKRSWTTLRALAVENYSSENLEKYLNQHLGNITMGDTTKIKCGLAINSKRADTYSLWTVANHPDGIYYEANKNLTLAELCRASSAAPYYFKPKKLKIHRRNGESFEAAFIDGGVSLANNPAWQGFLLAVVPSFGFQWNPGKDNLYITSLGTGNGEKKENPAELIGMRSVNWAPKLSDLFMIDALEMNQVILEAFGYNVGSRFSIDSQFKDLADLKLIDEKDKLFSFQRHNVVLTRSGIDDLGMTFTNEEIDSIKEMDHHENIEKLIKIGATYAGKYIDKIL